MEMQACSKPYNVTADTKKAHYSQGFATIQSTVANNTDRKMKVLFSGCGKAERDMGLAPIPSLYPFENNFNNCRQLS